MLRLRHLSAALIAGLVISAGAQAGTTDINQVVVFGDSLSDVGNIAIGLGLPNLNSFTTNPGEVTVEHIADHYGITLKPSLYGGTDFAFGGAGVLNNSPGTPASVPTITAQVTNYISVSGGLDAHTLYTMWGGANDIFYHATQVQTSAETSAQAQAGIEAAAAQEVTLLGDMRADGAKYVVVFNLPDVGLTPSANALPGSAQTGLTGLSKVFNATLQSGLNTLSDQGLNIVPVNVYALFNEVVADPSAFGFTDITSEACGAGSSSVMCGPQGSSDTYHYAPGTENTYLFADGVHPTTAGHAMLGQFVIAELTAPGQISMLGEAPLALTHSYLGVIHNQMRVDQAGGGSRTFLNVGYARQNIDATGDSPALSANNMNLTLGVDGAAGKHVNAGIALGLGRSNANISGGGFRLDSIMASGYAVWHSGGGYIGANVGFAQLSYNDIDRRFQIGKLTRNEGGQTSGSQIMSGLSGGWLFGSDNFQTGPFVGMEWQRISVDGYTEDGRDSSSMWYAKQQRFALVSQLGWRFEGNWKAGDSDLHPYINVAWNHDGRADPRKVRAGSASMPGSFAMTGYIPDADWGSVNLGLSAHWGASTRGWIALHSRFADSNQRVNGVRMGISIAF